MKRKIILSTTIFLFLFSMSWYWDSTNKRDFYEPTSAEEPMEMTDFMPLNVNNQNLIQNERPAQLRKYKIFKPREYVRIEQF